MWFSAPSSKGRASGRALANSRGKPATGRGGSIRPRLLAFAVTAISVFIATIAPAQNALFPGDKRTTVLPTDVPVEMHADRLEYDHEKRTYTARGNVTLSQGNLRVRADSVSYDEPTNTLTAKGRVIARRGGDVVEADKIKLRLDKASGVLFNGKLLLTRQNVYLEGKKIEVLGRSRYHIEQGGFTTCDGASPDWRITGEDLDVTLEGYGTLEHGVFYIRDIPVFYLPWLIYPAKQKRQTGFLTPSISNSTIKGFDIRLPFFLALSPSVDATLTPRICTQRAFQTSLEFRYVPQEDFHGRFYGEWTYDWKYGPPRRPPANRFYVTWTHDQDFFDLMRLKSNVNWVSDRDYFDVWGGRWDRRNRIRYLESNVVANRQWDNFLFQAEARHFDDLAVPDNAITVQNLPIVTGTAFSRQIPYTPFYMSANLVYDHYFAPKMHKHWFGSRLQMDSRLTLPVTVGRFLKILPSISYFGKAYAASYYERDQPVKEVNALRTDLFQVDADVFTDLESVYNTAFMGFQGIKHSIRPRVSWTYRPPTAQDDYPQFDDSDRLDRVSLFTAELRQTLTGRLGPRRYQDFFTLSVSQGYDFDKAAEARRNGADDEFPLGRGWTNSQIELTFRPHAIVDLAAQAEYDPIMNRARRYSVNMGLMDHRGDLVRVLHQFIEDRMHRDLNRQTNVNLLLKVTSNLDCYFENQYSHQYDFSYFTSFGFVYHPQCWSVELRYSEAREQSSPLGAVGEPDQTLFMTVSLYGLGQVYRMSRDWGDILGTPSEAIGSTRR